jgi:4-hydroxy-3-polyprenylbenzoate decarboxylase
VVGRPPQEDTSFGALIHEITGSAIPKEINGLHEVNAVDAAGVHPLLFAIGSERYTPYLSGRKPQEILTIANHILGKNQLSLAKYLFIAAREDDPALSTDDVGKFLIHMFERMDFTRDLHFYTKTTIDTLDYSGGELNTGSKVVFAAAGEVQRQLLKELPAVFGLPRPFNNYKLALPGVLAVEAPPYTSEADTHDQVEILNKHLKSHTSDGLALMVLCNDARFVAENVNNLVWIAFTRSNPSHDIYGINSFTENKHWACKGPLIIDARKKPHHAPELVKDPEVERRIERLGVKGASLAGLL